MTKRKLANDVFICFISAPPWPRIMMVSYYAWYALSFLWATCGNSPTKKMNDFCGGPKSHQDKFKARTQPLLKIVAYHSLSLLIRLSQSVACCKRVCFFIFDWIACRGSLSRDKSLWSASPGRHCIQSRLVKRSWLWTTDTSNDQLTGQPWPLERAAFYPLFSCYAIAAAHIGPTKDSLLLHQNGRHVFIVRTYRDWFKTTDLLAKYQTCTGLTLTTFAQQKSFRQDTSRSRDEVHTRRRKEAQRVILISRAYFPIPPTTHCRSPGVVLLVVELLHNITSQVPHEHNMNTANANVIWTNDEVQTCSLGTSGM